jgi:hypothetical protein
MSILRIADFDDFGNPTSCSFASKNTNLACRTIVVYALEMDCSPKMVMVYTKHEDYDTIRPYIVLNDKTSKKMMETNF